MWCPKCKAEYVEGITTCVDCDIALVDKLTEEMYTQDEIFELPKNMEEKYETFKEEQGVVSPLHTTDHVHAYIKKDYKLEDTKSTAYTFIIIGLLGLIAITLIALDIIPLSMASYMRIMMFTVMGLLFLIFLIIGISYLSKIKTLSAEVQDEESITKDITQWFLSNYTAKEIDDELSDTTNLEMEQLYFARYEIMQQLLQQKYHDLDASYEDHMLENLYGELYPEN